MLTVVLIVGVNGSGKTTSIAKLAQYYKRRGKKVVLAAADTFRAAAIDQLKIWGERTGVDVIAQGPGADPGAVVFDAIRASQESRAGDLLIIDTAGRLHTKYNLMKELEKVHSVCARQVHNAPHETLLVLDATTGQNAISQAKHFKEAVEVSGHHPDQARQHGQGRDRLCDREGTGVAGALCRHGREDRPTSPNSTRRHSWTAFWATRS